MFWSLDIDNDLAICLIPRSGNKCIRAWMGKKARTVPDDHPDLMLVSRRVAFIRNPLERLQSAYWLFYWMLANDGIKHISGKSIETWETFVDDVLMEKTPYEEHVMPQVEHMAGLANIIHRYENLAETFAIYKPGILPDRGRTTKAPVNTGYRLPEVIRTFANDLAIWMEAE